MDYRIVGGQKLSGEVQTNISKNAAVALLAASLLNRGTTTLRRMPRIEEVKRLIEVMQSMGVDIEWDGETGDMRITPPLHIRALDINTQAASKTRSIALFIAPLAHLLKKFVLPKPGGCHLGTRTLSSHIGGFKKLGIDITDTEGGDFCVQASSLHPSELVMSEASDTGTESILMAAAKIPGKTVIKFASANYMVQDLCAFLQACGVKIDGFGTAMLTVHGVEEISADIEGYPSEDPIESMFFISLAATTGSTLTIKNCPIDFLELELLTLENMGLTYERSHPTIAQNGLTHLADITISKGQTLKAPSEKIASRPYPGLNIDNLPFFVPIATQAEGRTLIHDWVYENRAMYYMEMQKLGADMVLADPHRVFIEGPTKLHSADIIAPPALRPATILLIGMLAADGESTLKNVYSINRGYENLHERLATLGAQIDAIGQ